MKKKFLLPSFLIVGFAFLLFSTSKTSSGIRFEPLEKINLFVATDAPNQETILEGESLMSFSLKPWGGYIDPNEFALKKRILADDFISYSDSLYYSTEDSSVQTASGKKLYSIQEEIPYFSPFATYLIYPASGTLVELDRKGDQLWQYSYSSYLVSFSDSKGHILLGFLDGTIVLLDRSGEVSYEYKTAGCETLATYGVALAPTEDRFAAVVCQVPQKFLFFQKDKDGFQIKSVHDLSESQREPVSIEFLAGQNGRLYFSLNETLYLYSLQRDELERYALPKNSHSIEVISVGKYTIYAVQESSDGQLVLLSSEGLPLLTFKLSPSETLLLRGLSDSTFLLGMDEQLLKIGLKKEGQ